MINDRKMRYIRSEDGLDYYVFSPSLFRLYYNRTEEWTKHRKTFSHRFHMLYYVLRGGLKILYKMDGDEVVAYLIYTPAGRTVVQGSTRRDLFSVYITTNPAYRRQGHAAKLVSLLLTGLGLKWDTAYKTIQDSNIGSQKAAFANGYEAVCTVTKSRFFRTVKKKAGTRLKLYARQNNF